MKIKMYLTTLFIITLCCINFANSQEDGSPIVSTPWGDIKGAVLTSRLGKSIFSFRGIRYAEAPVGDLRFQPPVPIKKVVGVYNATVDGALCPQPTTDPISEDCLFLNVYTTKLPNSKHNPKRPVIVHIHAGAFYSVTGASYWGGPQYFLDQDIVLVTFNYRIGSLGFISTGDKLAPGNNGLKDQVVVLKWVQQNIESFGGDPNSVTILGYSAGGWSVVLHMLSPLSKGLFHKAGALSGSILGIWPIPYNQTNLAQKQAKIVGCPSDTSANIIRCLKTKSAEELGNSLFQFQEFGHDPVLIWSPVIEPDVGEPRFLTENPIKLITKGEFQHVPLIVGRTKDEFSYFALRVLRNETLLNEMNKNFEKIAPISFLYERDSEFSKTVTRAIKKFYFKDKVIDSSQETALKEVYEDSIVGFQMHRAAKLFGQYSKSSVYYYRFSYQGRYSHVYLPGTNNTIPYGVVHHDDLIYLFYISKLFPLFKEHSPKEVEMVTKLTTLYYNFAKTGNPTPSRTTTLENVLWDTYNPQDQKYLDIGNKLVVKEKLLQERFKFWENLYPLSMYLD